MSNNFNRKFHALIWLSWNFVQLSMPSRTGIYHYFFKIFYSEEIVDIVQLSTSCRSRIYHSLFFCFCFYSREIIDIFSHLKKCFNVAFFSDTGKARSVKLCMIITSFRVYIFMEGFYNLDFVSGSQVCHKYQLQIVQFRFLSTVILTLFCCCML